jgi:hypothetical protein
MCGNRIAKPAKNGEVNFVVETSMRATACETALQLLREKFQTLGYSTNFSGSFLKMATDAISEKNLTSQQLPARGVKFVQIRL